MISSTQTSSSSSSWHPAAASAGAGAGVSHVSTASESTVDEFDDLDPKDEIQYVEQLKLQAEKNNKTSAATYLRLGQIYENPKNPLHNLTHSFVYFKKAADLGNPAAAWKISDAYRNGLGTTRDEKLAEKYNKQGYEGMFPIARYLGWKFW